MKDFDSIVKILRGIKVYRAGMSEAELRDTAARAMEVWSEMLD